MNRHRQSFLARAIVVATIIFGAAQAQSAAWASTATWNASWQDRFSQWIESRDVHIEMALQAAQDRDYLNVEMDCADFIYYLHAVFSFEHQLDFSVQMRNGQRLTNQTAQFDSIQDQKVRFKRFLLYLLEQTNTKTLQEDSVLLPISRDSVQAGAFLITDRPKNHVWLIKAIKPSGTPELLSATVPASNFIYPAFTFPTAASAFSNVVKAGYLSPSRGGFRRLHWPTARETPVIEQTQIPLDRYFATIAKALQIPSAVVTPDGELDRLLDETCLQLRIRTNIVTDAMTALTSRRSLTSEQVNQLSTESRDQRIRDLINQTRQLAFSRRSALSLVTMDRYHRLFDFDQTVALDYGNAEAYCLIQWAENRIEPMASIVSRFEQPGRVSSKARDSLEARWGEGRQ
ncbi:MAG: hypothetical protein IPJ84_09175 [Bdellovibrionales bacterium]|nr:hypothetical protein [Bdellovibrionales bacterium]